MANMPNLQGSSQARFYPAQNPIGDYVLNHPTASPFKKNNITFHIDGNYLNDFSRDGIKHFVKDNNRKLDYKEVGTFIQTVAANASQMAGASFDLEDKELGLFKKDDINQQDIKTGFMLETRSGQLPSQGVVFFDADKSTFPLKEVDDKIKRAQEMVKNAEKTFHKAEGKVENAQWHRQSLVDFLGKDSPKELAEKQSKISSLESTMADLKAEQSQYKQELEQVDGSSHRALELKRVLRGLDFEIRDTDKQLKDLKKDLSSKQGPLSFIGIGNSLSELQERNQNLSKAQNTLHDARVGLDDAHQQLDAAKTLRERILKGESLFPEEPAPAAPAEPPAAPEPPAPVEEPPAEPTPAAPAEPPAEPVDSEPIPIPAQPAEPPAAPEAPVQDGPVDEVIVPSQPSQPIPADPAPAQPPAEPAAPPAEPAPQPAQPEPPQGFVPTEVFIPGGRHNPVMMEGQNGAVQPAPAQPAPAQPTPVQQAPAQPAPAQPAPQQPRPPVIEEPSAPATQPSAPISQPSGPSTIGNGTVSKILYTVKRGDTLSGIAQSQLGNWKRWHEIADMNHNVIGTSNTHWIYPGQVLSLPPLQQAAN